MSPTHISPYSGAWYPAPAAELARLLDGCFEESRERTGPHLFRNGVGFVVPHAGPAYCGAVAAAVYRTLADDPPERVILLAFPHQGGLSGVAVPEVASITTPFGDVPIDAAPFPRLPEKRLCDHSFELQLPFLQKAAPQARITPLYVGRMDAAARERAAGQLAALWRPGTVFVASSDFTHYGRNFGHVPFPPDSEIAERLRVLDHEYIDAAGSLDSALFLETLAQHDATVCGAAPIALLLDTLRRLPGEPVYEYTLDYQTSGDRTGDFKHCVSYAALGYFRRSSYDLDAADREVLLGVACDTLAQLRSSGERRRAEARGGSPALAAHRGAFVSLHQGDELLGCIGNCAGRLPLGEEIADLTLAAALEDPRFRHAASAEGPIEIELSILTPLRRIRSTSEFEVGRHGAVLRLGRNSGLLLPQVAEGYGWTSEGFFRALARKSGLGPHAVRDPKARLEIFEAQIFSRSQG
ncbi:MAG: AmmeMemoRadiSam system protein B [Bryobacteraceae bacterium]|jgi:AmmeMemoRadiSam system protein B/AmmeMemoRadiSam system protein A